MSQSQMCLELDSSFWINLFESVFSHMKIIKSEYRSTMTDNHLVAWLYLATGCYTPDDAKIATLSQCPASH